MSKSRNSNNNNWVLIFISGIVLFSVSVSCQQQITKVLEFTWSIINQSESEAYVEPTTPAGVIPDSTTVGGNNSGNLKPVGFLNTGTIAATVMAWTFVPPGTDSPATPSNASTVAFPGGNSSSHLSLPMGTYTWCYYWELGDINDDGIIEYAHALDGRVVVLDESDSDTLDFAETVNLSAPTLAGDMEGQCGVAPGPVEVETGRTPLPNGDLLFSDDGSGGAQGMFSSEFMSFGYQNGQGILTANSNDLVLPAMYSNPQPMNLIVEINLASFSSGSGGQYGIIFRSDDVAGGLASYNIISLIPGTRTIEFAVWKENAWTLTSTAIIADSAISLNSPVRFRLEIIGSEYVVYLNGLFAARFVDNQITSPGILGISITTGSAPDTLAFDNLRIFDIP